MAQAGYQVHLLPPDGNLAGTELTSVSVGQPYDLVVSVRDLRDNPGPNAGVFAGYVDIGYDSSKTRVQVGEVQRLHIGPFTGTPAASGAFSLTWNGHVTAPIAFNSDVNALAAAAELAIGALPGVGLGNVTVRPDILNGIGGEVVLQVRFFNNHFDQNVANLSVAAQDLTGPSNPRVSLTYDGDLGTAAGASFAFTESFRSRLGTPAYVNGLFAGNQPNVLDDVGAFAGFAPTGPGPRELVRTRMVATAAGSVTFTADIANRVLPDHHTLLFDPTTPVPVSEIDLGTPKTLTISTAPIVAIPDYYGTVTNAFTANLDVLANDVTAAGQQKTISAVTQPPLGSASISLNRVVYIPAPGFTGTETFTYTAQAGGATSTGTISVTVVAPTLPLIRYQVRLVPPDGRLYQRDPENASALVNLPDLTSLNVGDEYDLVITVQPTSMTPLGIFGGYTDITYDQTKTEFTAANVLDAFRPVGRPSIVGVNNTTAFFTNAYFAGSAPGRIDDVGAFTNVQTSVGTAALTSAEKAAGYTVAPPRELTRARFKANAAGPVTFAADLNQIQSPIHDSLIFGITGKVTIDMTSPGMPKTINIVSPQPYLAAGDSATLLEDAAGVTIDVLANDTLPAPSTSKEIVSFTQPSTGTVTQVGQSLRYVPPADFSGTVTFTYTAKGNAATDPGMHGTATVTVTVNAVNDAPTLAVIASPVSILEDAVLQTIALSGISAGAGESQTLTVTAESSNPGLTGPISIGYQSPASGGTLSFQPVANASGTATVVVTVKDSGGTAEGGIDTVSRTFSLVVNPVNDAPTFTPGADEEATDESGPQTIAEWAKNISAGPGEAGQALQFSVVAADTSLFSVQPQINASGTLTYTPALNASGTTLVTVQLSDNGSVENGGSNQSAQSTFTITIVKLHLMHNAVLPLDTTGDAAITANDALRCINYLNAFSAGTVSSDPAPENRFLDVNADGFITAQDPLKVINHINSFGPLVPPGEGGGGDAGEGEAASGQFATLLALLAADTAEATRKRR